MISKIIKDIYILIITTLPLMYMPNFLKWSTIEGINYGIGSICFFIGFIFLLIYITKKRYIPVNEPIKVMIIILIWTWISSLFMATLMNNKLGVLWGEDTYRTIAGEMVYYLFYVIVIYFFAFAFKYITLKTLDKIMNIILVYESIIGLMQIAIYMGISPVIKLYDMLNIFEILKNSSFISVFKRITLTGTEPGSTALILGFIIFPYILSKLITVKTEKESSRYTKWLIFYIIISIFTFSATMYICLVLNLIIFFYFRIKKRRNIYNISKATFINRIIICLLTLIIFITLYISVDSFKNIINKNVSSIEYLLFEKVNDKENVSTMFRSSTLINDIKIIFKFPIMGIGNGMQGFYYNQNMPEWFIASNDKSIQGALNGELGVINGGSFIPAYVSGYGLCGVILMVIFIKSCCKRLRLYKQDYGYLYYMFFIAIIPFVISSLQGVGLEYMPRFIIAIPLMISTKHLQKDYEEYKNER